MAQEHRLEPKLRFPEFSGEWKKFSLGDVCEYTKGFAFKSKDYQNQGIRIIRVSDLGTDRIKQDNEKIFINPDKKDEYMKYKIEKGNILITTVGSHPDLVESAVGRGILIKKEGVGLLNQNMLMLENGSNDNNFIYGYLSSSRYLSHLKNIKRGNANQANITVKDLLEYKISLPPLPEQEKIASFLSSVDSKIEKLENKWELLSAYKKGMMQNIFSQEIRFSDEKGDEYPQWVEIRLAKIGVFNPTNSFSRALLNYEEGSVYNIHYGDIYTKFSTHLDLNKFDLPYVNNDVSLDKIKEESYCQEGDIIIADASESYEDIGSAIELSNVGDKKVLAGLHTFLLRPHKDMIAKGYMEQYLQSSRIRKEIKKIATGISVLGVSKGNLSKISLNLPCLEEQEKISSFLSSIDKKIELVEKEIEKNKIFKKGLLQQMFV